jgi:hypothetical protein
VNNISPEHLDAGAFLWVFFSAGTPILFLIIVI